MTDQTTPEQRAEHVYDATIWRYLDNVLRGDFVVRQEMIDHIAAEIRAAAPRWIPVSERMPEMNQFVLTLPEWGFPVVDFRTKTNWSLNAPTHTHTITHWQPLPAPPQEATND